MARKPKSRGGTDYPGPRISDAAKKFHEETDKEVQQAFRGNYGGALKELLELSAEDLEAISPGHADLETYAKLIAVVVRASMQNMSQADLSEQIKLMGKSALQIARLVAALAKLVR